MPFLERAGEMKIGMPNKRIHLIKNSCAILQMILTVRQTNMKIVKTTLIFIICLAVNGLASCEEVSKSWTHLGINEKQSESLNNYIKQEQKRDEHGIYLDIKEKNIVLIKTDVLDKLFKDYIFVCVPYELIPPKGKEKIYSIAMGLYETIAIDKNGKNTHVFFAYGNYEKFADFLRDQHIKVKSKEDAQKIWEAFCHIHQKGWEGDFIQTEKNKWKLARQVKDFRAISSYEEIQEEYYYLLELAEDKTVVSGGLHCDIIERRKKN